jgi:AsmA protein
MKKALKITGIAVLVILVLVLFMALVPVLFQKKFAEIVKNTANKNLRTELNFSSMEVSCFRHFPNLTVTLHDFSLKSSAPFVQDTLIRARDVSFGINLGSLISGPVRIGKVYLNRARIVVQYDESGGSNFNVYESPVDSSGEAADTAGTGAAALKIEQIVFSRADFIYTDPAIPVKLFVHGFNYKGQCEIVSNTLRLHSSVDIDALDFWYDGIPYLRSKPVTAELTTSVDMNSLAIKLEKNDLRIKDIPFEFRGELAFTPDGYEFFIALYSAFGEEHISGSLWLVTTKHLWISAKTDILIDLRKWSRNFGVTDIELGGMFSMKLKAQGIYSTGQDPQSKSPDTVLLSIPSFTFTSKLSDGSFRHKACPEPIRDISFMLTATADSDYRSTGIRLENLQAGFLDNRVEGYLKVANMKDFPVEGRLTTSLNLEELSRIIPLDSFRLQGLLGVDLDVNGNYDPGNHQFPVTRLTVNLRDGSVQTPYFPSPVENIQVAASVINRDGTLAGTEVKLDPFSFRFVGNPFVLQADLSDPLNLSYAILARGSVDIASVYKVFSRRGMDLRGYLSADLNLRGKQSDALAGQIDKLHNSGTLTLRNIAFTSSYLPKPLILESGVFRFLNDEIWFDQFQCRHGVSDLSLNGHLSNVVNYFLSENELLKGYFTLRSGHLLVDEFIAEDVAETVPVTSGTAPESGEAIQTGVIEIPQDLEIGLEADLKKVGFRGLTISGLTGKAEVRKGILLLKDLSFQLIGCRVGMDATYGSISRDRAFFDFHLRAENFDIKRAYRELELFRNLGSSAGKCEGIVSLDYSLKGTLQGDMEPVYPSLEGGGNLSLTKVKVMGMKLFTSMSRNLETEKIKNPDLSKVDLRTTIRNNVITLEKTKMKMSGFTFKVSGESNFNGRINLKARLGLPPLGIFGIPIRILGTMENPRFKYGRGNNDEEVEETEYTDELPAELLEKIRNAREEDLRDGLPEGD